LIYNGYCDGTCGRKHDWHRGRSVTTYKRICQFASTGRKAESVLREENASFYIVKNSNFKKNTIFKFN